MSHPNFVAAPAELTDDLERLWSRLGDKSYTVEERVATAGHDLPLLLARAEAAEFTSGAAVVGLLKKALAQSSQFIGTAPDAHEQGLESIERTIWDAAEESRHPDKRRTRQILRAIGEPE
jgi:hypothetical protein